MIRRAWLFGLILGIPLIGFSVAQGIQNYYNSELRDALKKQFPDADPTAIANATLTRLCEERTSELREICSTNHNLYLMSAAAVWAGSVGVLLLVGIRLAGSLARSNRRVLLWVFKPGLFFTALLLILLTLVHAVVAMAAMYYVESAFLGRVHVFIIGAIGFGALAGVVAMARNVFSLVRKAGTLVIGKIASRTDAPDLWKRIDGIADRLRALRPESLVLGLDPNFFVTEADVTCLTGNCTGRTLYCSLPLMRILSTNEFDAIIGHELGHYKGWTRNSATNFFRSIVAQQILLLHCNRRAAKGQA